MFKEIICPEYNEFYEYHGNTMIERIRKQADNKILRDWILFDSAEEAAAYFNEACCTWGAS